MLSIDPSLAAGHSRSHTNSTERLPRIKTLEDGFLFSYLPIWMRQPCSACPEVCSLKRLEMSTEAPVKCWLCCLEQKDWLHRSSQTSRVLAFYGLTSPPYKLDALEPYMSQKALEIHWVKHHGDYVERLNKQLANSPLYGLTLDELVKVAYNNGNPFPEFNNAAQLWNHNFFWESMQPDGGKTPTAGLLQQIEKDFGSFPNFKDEFATSAMRLFGSGWVWLVLKPREKRLAVVRTSNAVNPLALGDIPIINLDMWEHAYYLDYKNDRVKYVNVFMNHLVSWHSAVARMARAEAFVNLGQPKIPVA